MIIDEPAVERPIPLRDLTAGFGKRLQQPLHKTIELSCSSIQGERSEAAPPGTGGEVSSALVLILDVDPFGNASLVKE